MQEWLLKVVDGFCSMMLTGVVVFGVLLLSCMLLSGVKAWFTLVGLLIAKLGGKMKRKNVPVSSPVLLAFYESWLANRTAEDRTSNGLCICLGNFMYDEIISHAMTDEQEEMFWEFREEVGEEMQAQFVSAKLSHYAPFNEDYADYAKECANQKCHENKRRIQWVTDRINDARRSLR